MFVNKDVILLPYRDNSLERPEKVSEMNTMARTKENSPISNM
jgi:hypothetical protein